MCIRDRLNTIRQTNLNNALAGKVSGLQVRSQSSAKLGNACLLYTSDAADERSSVALGGRRIIKKENIRGIKRSLAYKKLK